MPDGMMPPPRREPPPMRQETKPRWGEFALFVAFGLSMVTLFGAGCALAVFSAPR